MFGASGRGARGVVCGRSGGGRHTPRASDPLSSYTHTHTHARTHTRARTHARTHARTRTAASSPHRGLVARLFPFAGDGRAGADGLRPAQDVHARRGQGCAAAAAAAAARIGGAAALARADGSPLHARARTHTHTHTPYTSALTRRCAEPRTARVRAVILTDVNAVLAQNKAMLDGIKVQAGQDGE